MSETTMPAAEAETVGTFNDELNAYELAFHILPTVAEGEVPAVFDAIKAAITENNGEIFDFEEAQRIDLAYEVVLHLEGKNRKFTSAYFGWIRFRSASEAVEKIIAEVDHNASVLRHLLIKLTKNEEQKPFRYHEAIKDQKMVTTVEDSEVIPDFTTIQSDDVVEAEVVEEGGEVDEVELDKALKEKEV